MIIHFHHQAAHGAEHGIQLFTVADDLHVLGHEVGVRPAQAGAQAAFLPQERTGRRAQQRTPGQQPERGARRRHCGKRTQQTNHGICPAAGKKTPLLYARMMTTA
ncbi:hypothetical protein JCM14635_31190 [Megalodesulfovibrio paquesii]